MLLIDAGAVFAEAPARSGGGRCQAETRRILTIGAPRSPDNNCRPTSGAARLSFDTDHPQVLTASCASRLGTTAAIAGFLSARRLYIMEMQQFDDTISQRFFVRATFCAVRGEPVDLLALRRDFASVASADEMDWRIHDSTERMRVLLMVSNFDHCLEDLLYRHRIGELKMDIIAIVSNHVTLQPAAAQHRIPFFHLPITPATKAEQERRLLELIESTRTELVVLARYMQILSNELCGKLRGRAINIHHSFLPGFKGAKTLSPGV